MEIVERGGKKYLSIREQGPDTRYRTRGRQIPLEEIPQYLEAYEENFKFYEEQKEQGFIGSCSGKKGMRIHVGGLYEGVCIFGHASPIRTREQLEERKRQWMEYLKGENGEANILSR